MILTAENNYIFSDAVLALERYENQK